MTHSQFSVKYEHASTDVKSQIRVSHIESAESKLQGKQMGPTPGCLVVLFCLCGRTVA